MVFAHGTLLYILLPSFDPIVHYEQSVPQYKYSCMWTANIILFSHIESSLHVLTVEIALLYGQIDGELCSGWYKGDITPGELFPLHL